MGRQYDPRKSKARTMYTGKTTRAGELGWTRNITGLYTIFTIAADDDAPVGEDIGPGYGIRLPGKRGARDHVLILTTLTEKEFLALKTLFDTVFDLALPVIKERDRIANAAADQDDDNFHRYYRSAPELVIKPGQIKTHRVSIYNGPEDVPLGSEADVSPDGGLRGTGDGLADEAQKDSGAEDDEPKAD